MTDERSPADREIEIEIERERPRSDETGVGANGGSSSSNSNRNSIDDVDGEYLEDLDVEDAPEQRLADELGRIDLMTTPEGYVEGRVTELAAIDETTVRLEVALPHGDTASFRLEKPIPWSREFLLARIVEDVGYDAASIEHLVGESVYLKRIDVGEASIEDGWGWQEWCSNAVRTTGNAVLSSIGGTLRLEERRSPEWRLVDPLERADSDDTGLDPELLSSIGTFLLFLGVLVAAAGAVFGATGAVALSSATIGYALPGVVLVVLGYVLLARRT